MSPDKPQAAPPPERGQVPGEGPGRQIRAARERAGLGIEELAAQIKLARGTLEAIEGDDFARLNEPVFVRGYYRKCARVLGLDETSLLAAYEALVAPRAPAPPTRPLLVSGDELVKPRRGGGRVWVWLGIALVLVAAAAWLQHTLAPESRPVARQAGVAPAPMALRPVPPAYPQTSPAAAGSAPPAVGASAPAAARYAAGAAASAAVPARITTAAPAVAASAAPAGGQLVLQFDQTSWVRIEDAGGQLLLSGLIRAGERRVLQGTPPYSVFLGNAPGVQLRYAGRTIDISTYTRADATARLTVP